MNTTARHLCSLLTAAAALVIPAAAAHTPVPNDDLDGDASSGIVHSAPNDAVQVSFTQRSYRPGETATLLLRKPSTPLSIRFYHAGAGRRGPLQGAPVGTQETIRSRPTRLDVRIGDWPSGLYYADVTT